MHNIKWIRENPDAFDKAMERRNLAPVAQEILQHDEEKRKAITELQDLQSQSNSLAKEIGMKKAKGEDADDAIAKSKEVKTRIAELKEQEEKEAEDINEALLDNLLYTLPNILSDDVPDGEDESDNVEVRRVGEPKILDFDAKEHFELGEELGMMDFAKTVRIAGSRFSSLSGQLAKLERALAQFMLDIHTQEFGYEEVCVPVMVKNNALIGTSQLPKFEEDLFKTDSEHYLIPTAEVPLTNMVREEIIDEDKLPIRLTSYTQCFRSEAGSAGKDTRGIIRQHQFSKVELVSITTEEDAVDELERKVSAAEEVLKRLELPYRVCVLCSKDTGFGSKKTYDIEVWLPGQAHYREISSISWFGDFQGRRMNSRCRKTGEKNTRFVHTLNGSGVAIGRTIVAILENYQNEDGSITIPKALIPYMGGDTVIEKEESGIFTPNKG